MCCMTLIIRFTICIHYHKKKQVLLFVYSTTRKTSVTRGMQSLLLLRIITVVIHGCMMCSYINVYAEQMQSSTTDTSSCNLSAVTSTAIIHNTKGYYIIVEQGHSQP